MNLTSFYPGPSQLYPQVEGYLQDAYRSGILSMNHRSGSFMDMLAKTVADMHVKLDIPTDYEVYFTSSATECWEIVSQSLVQNRSLHAYNGAFGQKWFEYASRLHPASGHAFGPEEDLNLEGGDHVKSAEVLCLTHNETSNGTALPARTLHKIRQEFKGIIAVDATSSMAGVALPWSAGDVWFASVQKCFGLPPGLGVLVVSPRAIERAETIGERDHYNSLLFLRDNFVKNQTPYTPNTLGIYLLGRVLEEVPPIADTALNIARRAQAFCQFLNENSYKILIKNPEVRSPTVLTIEADENFIKQLKEKAREAGILLGTGYGAWKATTFRIANFPAISDLSFAQLQDFLEKSRL
ncbi:aminotransferase class V-fold PLP-dependent enzyme [Persicitalea jodogahamensis]|uniref:Aspartate aminotransferase n=1 Tax=Persicitalea jodogahamensis TaxID=402147 RepID=A0A8J3D339_9BACT|nr:aminotransferase class V-fold PLP-dependent enzyme [Persicitalea jodogahamensis]GHB64881.1 aspartate aminotransferase [Persicitalea jodogahamensis]